jgi:hypothetical protein
MLQDVSNQMNSKPQAEKTIEMFTLLRKLRAEVQ